MEQILAHAFALGCVAAGWLTAGQSLRHRSLTGRVGAILGGIALLLLPAATALLSYRYGTWDALDRFAYSTLFAWMIWMAAAPVVIGLAVAVRMAERALRSRRGEPQQARFVVDASAVVVDLRGAAQRLRPEREAWATRGQAQTLH